MKLAWLTIDGALDQYLKVWDWYMGSLAQQSGDSDTT
jgi:hypothetical protein